jgi:hypothetical protein
LEGAGALLRGLEEAERGTPEALSRALQEHASNIAPRLKAAAAEPPSDPDDEEFDEAEESSRTAKVETDDAREAQKLVFILLAALLRDIGVAAELGGPSALLNVAGRTPRFSDPRELFLRLTHIAEAESMIDRNVALPLVCDWLSIRLFGAAVTG